MNDRRDILAEGASGVLVGSEKGLAAGGGEGVTSSRTGGKTLEGGEETPPLNEQ